MVLVRGGLGFDEESLNNKKKLERKREVEKEMRKKEEKGRR